MSLVHLHRHSEWSLLDGVGDAEMWAGQAAKLGQPALSITDHGSLAGVLYHAEACEEVGIKPIFGMEAYFRPDIKKDRDEKNRYGYFHLLLLAKNEEGFRNLMRITSASYEDKYFYQKPNVDWNLLNNHKEGLIASSSCISGYAPKQVLLGNEEEAEKYIDVMLKMFGDDFFLETQPHPFDEQKIVNKYMINLALKRGINVVATADAHYPYSDWASTQDILLMINTGQSTKSREDADEDEREYMQFTGDTYYLMTDEELFNEFKGSMDLPDDLVTQMINASGDIADRIDHVRYDKSPKIPRASESLDEAEKLIREWCEEGLVRIGKDKNIVYRDRLQEELAVMRKLKVFDYFIIGGDMMRWAKSNGIRCGAGRGSAAGCLVAYLIGITSLDPIGYKLLFERFLNEYRTEIPDIDIDFEHERRDEVKAYLKEKWGDEYVVSVASFQSLGHKSCVQAVARVLDVSFPETKKVTDKIPNIIFGESLETLEIMIPDLRAYFDKYPEVEKHSKRLQGQIKGTSRHAGAVVVTNEPARDLIPMMKAKDGSMVTQWSERGNAQLISPYGFLKIDCLATKGLTVQRMTTELIEERHGVRVDFEDPTQFPVVEDPYLSETGVVKEFAAGMNVGIFQFGEPGAKNLLREIKPEHLEHIIAANALNRPGTLSNGVAYEYARRKNGKDWKIVDEVAEPYLGPTYGLIIYQEQVMQMYRVLGKDVLPSEAAIFLKVVAKGIARDLEGKKKLQAYFDKFARGCEEKGIEKSAYEEIWNNILQMTTYSFNKSHSAGYGLQAYQDMWLKQNYPLEFYTSLLTVEDETTPVIRESRIKGISILPPDINISDVFFTIDDEANAVRFGLYSIKNVGPVAVKELIENRPFENLEDLEARCVKQKVNKKVKDALLMSGALDSFGLRNDTIEEEKAIGEREYLGFTLSRASEIEQHKERIRGLKGFKESHELEDLDGGTVFVGGEVVAIKEIKTRHGDPMAFIDLAFGTDEYSLTLFPEQYAKYASILSEGNAVVIKGDWDASRKTVTVKNAATAQALAEAGG
jgi:DNA polymerase-3 subunit alpha